MSDGDGMDFILECVVSGAHGFLLLHPVVPALMTDATRGPKRVVLIRSGEPPGTLDRRPGSLPQVAG
jgi:hypothetical protein